MDKIRKKPSVVAFIPARSGSKRVPNKNIYTLAGHPMIAYTILSAIQSDIFDDIIVSTDSEEYAEIAEYYGAKVPELRPPEYSGDTSPDIEWVTHFVKFFESQGKNFDCFSILRPTSPFRKSETIKRAWNAFLKDKKSDSLRAVEKCRQHPGKMWILQNNSIVPLLPFKNGDTPWHSSQYQTLPEIYVQNASLEIAETKVLKDTGSITGEIIMPFFTKEYEGFDINDLSDIYMAEKLVKSYSDILPEITLKPFYRKQDEN